MIENYLSAYHDRSIDKIVYWTRSEDGKRHQRFAKPPYYFYHPDKNGIYEGLDGVKLSKKDFHDKEEFEIGCRQYSSKYESDIQPVSKFLMDNFYGVKAPEVVYGLFDIEVNYSSKIGFSSPKNPYAEINAITIYRSDLKNFITLAIPPPGWSGWDSSASDLNLENILLFDTEKELLDAFLTLADEVDVLSGWNSDFFDVPYVGKRVELVLGKSHLKRLGYNGGPEPKWGEAKKFKHSSATEMVLDIRSKIHLDYMRLFKKFSQGGRESFSLAAIADSELDIPKLHYEGTLENLYKTDFTTFIRYNIRDTEILLKFEEKFKYIALANTMAHEATVEFDAVFGSVKLIDTAIINYSRHELKKIVYDRRPKPISGLEAKLQTAGSFKEILEVVCSKSSM
jgi:DNA polymerase elongation subunit (family B)